jgi:hypothetical protein
MKVFKAKKEINNKLGRKKSKTEIKKWVERKKKDANSKVFLLRILLFKFFILIMGSANFLFVSDD